LREPIQSETVRPSDQIGPSIGTVTKEAVIAHYGTVKAAAFALGKVDESLMMREFSAGKLARFDAHADGKARAALSDAFEKAYGHSDPRARRRQLLRSLREHLNELSDLET
jgi:hypothetical protein